MVTSFSGKSTDVKLLQPKKAQSPMVSTLSPRVNDANRLQCWKALQLINVTELGMEMDVKLAHPEKASMPISVMVFGKVTEAKLSQFWKTFQPVFSKPVKYCSSSKLVMSLFSLNTVFKLVTAAASL